MAKTQGKKPNIVLKIILFLIIAIVGVAAILLIVYGGSVLKMRSNAKDLTKGMTADTFRETASSVIYDIDDEIITTLSGIKELYYVESDDIPLLLKNTFVLMEDKDFYSHKGVDFSSIARAAIANITKQKITQGASTITQQLAKNMFLSSEVSWERKITEMFIAIELEDKFSKTQILEFYLNNIYFQNGYYGIQAAAQGYFGKDVWDLSISQMAFLASIPKNPNKYDPVEKYDNVIERRDYILGQLYAEGLITSLEYYEAIEEKIVLVKSDEEKYDYIVTYVFNCATRALMKDNGFEFKNTFTSDTEQAEYQEEYDEWYSKYQASLFTSGYKIYTAIDMEKQELLQATLDDKLKEFTDTNDEGIYKMQGAAVCIDNSTGLVTAIVGGRSQKYDGYTLNRAFQSYRQPGSSIKPLNVYTPYFMKGHLPTDTIEDEKLLDGPANDHDIYRGTITIRDALSSSSNVCAWKIFEEITPAYGMSFLQEMNFKKTSVDNNYMAASIGGLTYGVSPVEMASGFATLENKGVYREPSCIRYITDSKDAILLDSTGTEKQVYTDNASRMTTKILQYNLEEGALSFAKLDNVIAAAKTGTTNDNKDGWVVGYSRYYTTAVWAGYDIPESVENLAGASYPMNVWHEYMEKIHEGLNPLQFDNYDESVVDEEGKIIWEETTTKSKEHPTYGPNSFDMGDGDEYTTVNGDGDKDVDVSGMGDQPAR